MREEGRKTTNIGESLRQFSFFFFFAWKKEEGFFSNLSNMASSILGFGGSKEPGHGHLSPFPHSGGKAAPAVEIDIGNEVFTNTL